MSYCYYIRSGNAGEHHIRYHDEEYGYPIDNDNGLFERLVLEINQAGLSWDTILKKQDNFRTAYLDFDLPTVATFGEGDIERLMGDAGIIRNRLKISAAIDNARTILRLQDECGSFGKWLDSHHPLTREEWTKLFKKTFRFTGGEIVNEFLMSTGYLPDSHDDQCPIRDRIAKLKPRWMDAK